MALEPIQVTGGLVQGVHSTFDAKITLYKGIPYAAPPIGANRFRRPQPVVPWSGVKLCDTNGPMCPQLPPDPRYLDILKDVPQSEDCLYLNLYIPDAKRHEGPFPVFMWLHGGMFREGGSADPNFDGHGLARKGVIVVLPVFRLSTFGFLAHPELSAEDPYKVSGNMGLLDSIQALEWINQNIAAFGGDPSRVTVGGQSSGSAMTQFLLLSPLSKGLIHGACIQSGARSYHEPSTSNGPPSYRRLKTAEEDGVELLKELGVKDIAELREYSDIHKLAQLGAKKDHRLWGPPPFYRGVLDGHVMPKMYHEMMMEGPANDVPVLTGYNSHEQAVWNEPRLTVEDLDECVRARVGPNSHAKGSEDWVRRWYQMYPRDNDEMGKGPLDCWNMASREIVRINISLWAQEYHQKTTSPVYGYYFVHHPPPFRNFTPDNNVPKVPGYTQNKGPLFGAFHSAEIPYMFNSVLTSPLREWTDKDRVVGEKMSQLWANFCKHGNPNGKGPEDRPEGVHEWPNLIEQPDLLQELGGSWETIETARPEAIAMWREFESQQIPW